MWEVTRKRNAQDGPTEGSQRLTTGGGRIGQASANGAQLGIQGRRRRFLTRSALGRVGLTDCPVRRLVYLFDCKRYFTFIGGFVVNVQAIPGICPS